MTAHGFAFYDDRILPHLINFSMRNRELRPYRERVLAQSRGRVLEIGVGSGLTLPPETDDVSLRRVRTTRVT